MPRPEKPVAKLGWLLDGELRFEPHAGPARLAAQAHVDALRGLGRIEPIDEALASTAVLLGEAIDSDPTSPSLWAQFRAALADLTRTGAAGEDLLGDLVRRLSSDVPDAPQS